MNQHVRANRELGANDDMSELVAKIRGFDHDTATPSDQLALARALKLLAEDIVTRQSNVAELEAKLTQRLALADVSFEMADVFKALNPLPKKRWWRR